MKTNQENRKVFNTFEQFCEWLDRSFVERGKDMSEGEAVYETVFHSLLEGAAYGRPCAVGSLVGRAIFRLQKIRNNRKTNFAEEASELVTEALNKLPIYLDADKKQVTLYYRDNPIWVEQVSSYRKGFSFMEHDALSGKMVAMRRWDLNTSYWPKEVKKVAYLLSSIRVRVDEEIFAKFPPKKALEKIVFNDEGNFVKSSFGGEKYCQLKAQYIEQLRESTHCDPYKGYFPLFKPCRIGRLYTGSLAINLQGEPVEKAESLFVLDSGFEDKYPPRPDILKKEIEALNVKAKNAPLVYAAQKALRSESMGYYNGYGVSLDASASGIQLLGTLFRNKLIMEITNTTGEGKDPYEEIVKSVLSNMGYELPKDVFLICRDDGKKGIMTYAYNSTVAFKANLANMAITIYCHLNGKDLLTKYFFRPLEMKELARLDLQGLRKANGEPYVEGDSINSMIVSRRLKLMEKSGHPMAMFAKEFIAEFEKQIEAIFPELVKMRKALLPVSAIVGANPDGYYLTAPEGKGKFHICPEQAKWTTGTCMVKGKPIQYGTNVYLNGMDYHENPHRGLLANFTHMIDAWVLRETVKLLCRAGIPVMTIHDCYRVPSGCVKEAQRIYQMVLRELYSRSDVLLANFVEDLKNNLQKCSEVRPFVGMDKIIASIEAACKANSFDANTYEAINAGKGINI